MTTALAVILAFLVGLLVGLLAWHRTRSGAREESEALRLRLAALEAQREADAEKLAWAQEAEKRMSDAFGAIAGKALQANMEALKAQAKGDLKGVVDPLKENLTTLDGYVRELEKSRKGAYDALQQKLFDLGETQARLQKTTTTLTQALKSSTVRGNWGEMQLRRVVEMAGMAPHVMFKEQESTEGGRPDMVVYLPNHGVLPVDSKAPLDAYLAAMEESDERARSALLERHARAMRDRVKELGQKKYWDQFERAPDFVVMFVPNEACLGAAFEKDADLLEYAIDRKVLISSPVNLLALLKAVAYGWQQQQVADNAKKIAEEGREIYSRIEKFVDHFSDVGKTLGRAVVAFNDATGSLDRRLIPAARKFREMGVKGEKVDAPKKIEVRPSTPLFDGLEDRGEKSAPGTDSP